MIHQIYGTREGEEIRIIPKFLACGSAYIKWGESKVLLTTCNLIPARPELLVGKYHST